ncbi:Protein-tyrosine phosphatase [Dictyocaulus viviparus]|uniref:Protein-tyrosine phosphatase n=1 Tax=Dictyocaulus viviparus TaxID=29172 RepID=A0A0D8Y9Q2_DICVI|nr:Protein-tyrosine phosphatase [Dictyocaulus viviparus]
MEDLRRIRSGDNSVLYEEFQILEVWDLTRERSCCAAEKARTRNRFADILPNDDSRVILRGPDDYINASLIDFIATQGPIGPEEIRDGKKENTSTDVFLSKVNDFWRMIWEKNVQCILMLTDCIENMRISQFHFLNWSDTRGPNSTEQLLDFIDRIAHKQFHKPIVVHCRTVDALRRQRSRMVQTAEQYLFLYEAMSTVITDRRL